MKKLRKCNAKKKTLENIKIADKLEAGEDIEKMNLPSLKSRLTTIAWDLKHKQFARAKLKSVDAIIKERLVETEGVITKDISDVKALLKGY